MQPTLFFVFLYFSSFQPNYQNKLLLEFVRIFHVCLHLRFGEVLGCICLIIQPDRGLYFNNGGSTFLFVIVQPASILIIRLFVCLFFSHCGLHDCV